MHDASPAPGWPLRTAGAAVSRRLRRAGPAALIGLAALAPFALSANAGVLDDMVLAAAYVVMALGLNIVVGFAGLLDLGYVAFVAIGAYTAAYFASGFWADAGPDGQGVAILVSGPVSQLHGIHVNFLLVFVLAVAATTVAGALIGVPTLRLRGDYVAVVTLAFGEIIGQVAANGGDIAAVRRHADRGPEQHRADRQDRPPVPGALRCSRPAALVLVRARPRRPRARRHRPAARLAHRPGLDRPARRRGRRGGRRGPDRPHEARRLRHRRRVRRRVGRLPGLLLLRRQRRPVPVLVLALRLLDGRPGRRGLDSRRGGRRHRPLAVNSYLLPDVLASLPRRVGLDFDFSAIASGVFGAIIVLVMLLRPNGLLPAQGAAGGERLGGGPRL